MTERKRLNVAVIGGGPLGLSVARELKVRNFADFTIFEASDAVGGTWHTHSYPGLACDVWAHSYTFPWARNPDWSANFVDQPEIEAYIQRAAREAGLMPHLRTGTRVDAADYQGGGVWQLTLGDGSTEQFGAVVSCIGNQFTPLLPQVPGMESFAGESWHSTNWRHDVDLTGKRVVVVGSAAAAVQIVPEVAKIAGEVTVLQRTPNWIMPRNKKVYSRFQRRLFRHFPALNRALIAGQGMLMRMVHDATTLGHKRMEQFESVARKYIERSFSDSEMRAAVTPKTRYGCKRPLVSDDFYPALNQSNVSLVAAGLAEVTPAGLVTDDGRRLDADVIIYCTGYKVLDFDRIRVNGEAGKNLAAAMADAPEAYKGVAVPGFPNFFFGIGPNGVALTVSYFISADLNAKAIVKVLAEKESAGAKAISVKTDLNRSYNDWMRGQFPRFSWGSSSCNSYYQAANGSVPFLFPDNFSAFKAEREALSLSDFEVEN